MMYFGCTGCVAWNVRMKISKKKQTAAKTSICELMCSCVECCFWFISHWLNGHQNEPSVGLCANAVKMKTQ